MDDVVRALLLLMEHTGAIGQVFNVGSTEEVSILELARLVKRLAASESEVCFFPYDEAYAVGFEDMPRRLPDISKIQRLLGFRPTHDLERIVDDVIAHEREPAGQMRRPWAVPVGGR